MYRLIGSTHSLSGLAGATAEFLRALDSVRKTIAEGSGLSGSELRAMAQIAETDEATPKQLADALEMTTGAITAITTALVSRGLLTRHEHPQDRRSLLLELTPDGHDVMQKNYVLFQDAIAAAAESLDAETESTTIAAIGEITAVLRARSET